MKILLTNDDGYSAEGIISLALALADEHDVYVSAPATEKSGAGHALTFNRTLCWTQVSPSEMLLKNAAGRDIPFHAVHGSPADAVKFALEYIYRGEKFDLVISGINEGLNITYDILHSGTVGACIESLMYDVPCIAFSAEKNLDFAKDYVSFVMDFILKNKLLSNKYCINVNFPIDNIVKGIKLAKVVQRKDNRYFSYDGQIAFPKRDIDNHLSYPKDSDVYLVNEGYIAISFLKKDFYSETLFNQFKDSGIF